MSNINGNIKIYDPNNKVVANQAQSFTADFSDVSGLTAGTTYSGDFGFAYTPPAASEPITVTGQLTLRSPSGVVVANKVSHAATVDLSAINWLVNGTNYWVDISAWSFTYTPTVSVPNVVGLTDVAADSSIAKVGLLDSESFASSSTVAAGNIISQSPAAGTSVPAGSTVTKVISTGAPSSAPPQRVPGTIPVMPTAAPSYVTNCPTLAFSENFQSPTFYQTTSEWGPIGGTTGKKFIVHKPDGYDFGGYGNPAGQQWAFDTSKGFLSLDMHNYYQTLAQNGDGNWFRSCISTMANITSARNANPPGVIQSTSTGFGASAPCYWEVYMWLPPVDPSEPANVAGLWPSVSYYTDPANSLSGTPGVEIDHPEMYSVDYTKVHLSSRTWTNGTQSGNIGTTLTLPDLSTGWHKWGVWIDTAAITYYIDDKQVFTGGTQAALGSQKLFCEIMNGYGGGWHTSMNPGVNHNLWVAYLVCFTH